MVLSTPDFGLDFGLGLRVIDMLQDVRQLQQNAMDALGLIRVHALGDYKTKLPTFLGGQKM